MKEMKSGFPRWRLVGFPMQVMLGLQLSDKDDMM
jgi:hypothetical protein